MSKFTEMLSSDNKTTLSKRASDLSEATLIEVDTFMSNLRRERLQLNTKLNNLTDLSPENTYSLRPGGDKFKPEEWMKELHQVNMDIRLKEIEMEIAKEIYAEWFGESSKALPSTEA